VIKFNTNYLLFEKGVKMSRQSNRIRKKKSRVLKAFALVFIIFIAISSYIYIQYQQGIEQAGSSDLTIENPDGDFEAAPKPTKLEKVNVLLLGVDSRGEAQSRTDTIMIAQYDPAKKTAKLISLMRDIYVEIPNHNNYKINTAYFLGGPELLRQTLELNFGVDIHYYAVVDFKGFEKAVDTLAPEGIEIEVEKRMSEKIGVVLEPGLQELSGEELLGYARFRQDAEGDFGRVERQQKVLNVLMDEFVSLNGVTKIPKLLGTVQPYIDTNLDGTDLLALLKDVVINPPDTIDTIRIPVDDSYTMGSYQHAGSVLEIDFEKNKLAIDQFLNNTSQGGTVYLEE
jgi:polyisoprenyl-teichoic acid--peptidoglycan teichoic acid transferase